MACSTRYLYFKLLLPRPFNGRLFIAIKNGLSKEKPDSTAIVMNDRGKGVWTAKLSAAKVEHEPLQYFYFCEQEDGLRLFEEGIRTVDHSLSEAETVYCIDQWSDSASPASAFLKAPFKNVFFGKKACSPCPLPPGVTHVFRVRAAPLPPDEVLCLLGNFSRNNSWDTQNPVLMHANEGLWEVGINLNGARHYEYKYGIYNLREKKFCCYEEGPNRLFTGQSRGGNLTIVTDLFFRFGKPAWRGAGISVPVFSLRSRSSVGIGEFTDLKILIDWAQKAGFKLIQLLPVNDTTATQSWRDSYPYAAISAFALNPVYINLEKCGRIPEDDTTWLAYKKQKEQLALLPEVEYEKVLQLKWTYLRALFKIKKSAFLKSPAFKKFFLQHRHWLVPYAAFCFLRDKYGTANYARFGCWSVYDEAAVEQLTAPSNPDYNEIAIHYFIQFHLHAQLRDIALYAHKKGVALKGDIPIGIYRHSVEAWMHPDEFNLDRQAGAPPDAFAVKGQNWGFPTYNWDVMEAGGFCWWKSRLQHLAQYFDVIRYDHILGFFRIWQIPATQIEGIMGYFEPDLPYSLDELATFGLSFDEYRFCRPFISERVIKDFFGQDAARVEQIFLEKTGKDLYHLKPEFDNQQKIDQYFRGREAAGDPLAGHLRLGLFDLVSNILFFPAKEANYFRPRINLMQTASFQSLPAAVQDKLHRLHDHYFYHRHEQFWREEAMRKLPVLKRATDMLVCGEDLGMVADNVPQVMHDLGLLSLEVQRMPKRWGQEFTCLDRVPYLSVVTPGTHDMSTVRAWWEEDREKTQRFYNEVLGHHGAAPYFCEPWVVQEIIDQHFRSPAMWALIQLQDLLGMSGTLRHENPHDERINIPSNSGHYWRYRMHLDLEQLDRENKFTDRIARMIRAAGR